MMRENFKGLLKMRDISSMRSYRGTLSKMLRVPRHAGRLANMMILHNAKY